MISAAAPRCLSVDVEILSMYYWSPEEKRRIVQEGLESGNVSETRLREGHRSEVFYLWRNEAERRAKAPFGGGRVAVDEAAAPATGTDAGRKWLEIETLKTSRSASPGRITGRSHEIARPIAPMTSKSSRPAEWRTAIGALPGVAAKEGTARVRETCAVSDAMRERTLLVRPLRL